MAEKTKEKAPQVKDSLHAFINKAQKAKVAVVVPLFGYWADAPSQQLNEETLKYVLDRVYSNIHNVVLIFVAEEKRLTPDVANLLVAKGMAGNTKGVPMAMGSKYGEYLRAGIDMALDDEVAADYVIVVNPWVMMQFNGLDILIDRINRDDAKIVSGFDVRNVLLPEQFDVQNYNIPQETRAIDVNLFGMKRATAEIINFDEQFKTHYFIGRDAWQSIFAKGFESVITQRVPIFSFEVDWHEFETAEQYEEDRQHFTSKWHYEAGDIKY